MTSRSVELWLELEPECNLACKFCYNYWKDGSSRAPTALSTSETAAGIRLLIEQFQPSTIAFSGGEPLLRPDLVELVKLVKAYGATAILTTNGTLLSSEKIAELIKAGVDTFQISFHSHDPLVHDYLSGGTAWRAALSAIINVMRSGSEAVPVFVASTTNLCDFTRVVKMMGTLAVPRVIFNRFIPTGLGLLNFEEIGVPDDSQLIEELERAHSEACLCKVQIILGTPIDVPHEVIKRWTNIEVASCPVGSGQRRWTVSADMNLRRCNQSGASVGSVFSAGLQRVATELAMKEAPVTGSIKLCNHLSKSPLVQISPTVTTTLS